MPAAAGDCPAEWGIASQLATLDYVHTNLTFGPKGYV